MPINRLEMFCDGVMAIIITIMMLELKIPHDAHWSELVKVWPVFISYILSFLKVGIYWKNHHHLLHTIKKTTDALVWSNLHWLFWVSLLPFTTGWMGENNFASITVALYATNLLFAALAYGWVRMAVINEQTREVQVQHKEQKLPKGYITVTAYCIAIPFALLEYQWISGVIIVSVAIMWLVTDKLVDINRDL